MIRFLFRFLATIALAIAVIMAVLDATRTVAAKQLVVTPLFASWASNWPSGLDAVRASLEKVAAFAWDPIATSLLALPGFVIFAALALLLYAIGHQPRRRIGRFVINN